MTRNTQSASSRRDEVRRAKAASIRRAKKLPAHLQEQLRGLASMKEGDVDFSDIPDITDAEWRNRKKYLGLFYRPMKKSVTIRLDADLLAWFKAKGSGYQTAINRVLREYFANHQ